MSGAGTRAHGEECASIASEASKLKVDASQALPLTHVEGDRWTTMKAADSSGGLISSALHITVEFISSTLHSTVGLISSALHSTVELISSALHMTMAVPNHKPLFSGNDNDTENSPLLRCTSRAWARRPRASESTS